MNILLHVAGKGVIIGTQGGSDMLHDVVTDLGNLKSRIKYL